MPISAFSYINYRASTRESMVMQNTLLLLDRIGCVFVRFLVFNASENVLVGFHALMKAPVVRKEGKESQGEKHV